MAVIIPHVEHQSLPRDHCHNANFFGFKKNPRHPLLPRSCPSLLPRILFSLSSVKHSPSYTKIRCRAKLFFHRSFKSQRSSFFRLARHRNKIKLIVPRRQTVLRNSPTRTATPCARPKDLQLANWKPLDTSDWRSRILRKRVDIALTPPNGN
ncbi:hypothetical protein AVEN_152086-1 [Araneus ventricosus]|uniref:Uncharacterized protein n=1 Tax=Araneus ventricosus TaxID=182803 RepID=A0A4Y2SZE2_ARAVE|nr:hypothetical protein AVEN_152086-1 [Araneus ventricosus]